MMNIYVLCVGGLKEKYFKDMSFEYSKRLTKYCKFNVIEVVDEKLPERLNETLKDNIKQKESSAIIAKLYAIPHSYIFVLDERGKEYTSIEFSKRLENLPTLGYSNIVFIIGGSLGLNNNVLNLGNENISFSHLTFPHQMIRVFLFEQIFRAFKIMSNETYHH